jgi:DNA polymerase-3 subunit epsilon
MIYKTFSCRDDVVSCLENISKYNIELHDESHDDFYVYNKKRLLKETEFKNYINEFVVLDTETTGLSPRMGDKIVQVAAVRYVNFVPVESFVTLVNPERKIPYGVSMIHHIFDKDVENSPKFWQIKKSLKSFLGDSLIIGHNIHFDLRFLISEGLDIPNSVAFDTIFFARKTVRLPSYRLSNLCLYFNLDFFYYHNALEDVLATGEVLKNLLALVI